MLPPRDLPGARPRNLPSPWLTMLIVLAVVAALAFTVGVMRKIAPTISDCECRGAGDLPVYSMASAA